MSSIQTYNIKGSESNFQFKFFYLFFQFQFPHPSFRCYHCMQDIQ